MFVNSRHESAASQERKPEIALIAVEKIGSSSTQKFTGASVP
jgi:hypothetical protein